MATAMITTIATDDARIALTKLFQDHHVPDEIILWYFTGPPQGKGLLDITDLSGCYRKDTHEARIERVYIFNCVMDRRLSI